MRPIEHGMTMHKADALALPDAELCRLMLGEPFQRRAGVEYWGLPRANYDVDIADAAGMAALLRAEIEADPGAWSAIKREGGR